MSNPYRSAMLNWAEEMDDGAPMGHLLALEVRSRVRAVDVNITTSNADNRPARQDTKHVTCPSCRTNFEIEENE